MVKCLAAVSCSSNGARSGGVGFVFWLTGKLGRACHWCMGGACHPGWWGCWIGEVGPVGWGLFWRRYGDVINGGLPHEIIKVVFLPLLLPLLILQLLLNSPITYLFSPLRPPLFAPPTTHHLPTPYPHTGHTAILDHPYYHAPNPCQLDCHDQSPN